VNYCVLGVSSEDTSKLRAFLYRQKEWVLIYAGKDAVIFAKNVAQNEELIKKYGLNAQAHLTQMLNEARQNLGLRSVAERWSRVPDCEPLLRIGILAEDFGLQDVAEESFLLAWSAYPSSEQALNSLFIFYNRTGRERLAFHFFLASLTANKWSAYYKNNLPPFLSYLSGLEKAEKISQAP